MNAGTKAAKSKKKALDENDMKRAGAFQVDPAEGTVPVVAPRRLRRAAVVRASDVEPASHAFLWRPYLPLGALALLEGDPGAGKTFIALAIAAMVTRGWSFASADRAEHEERAPASVIYLSAEDSIAKTLRVRAQASGADLERLLFLTGIVDEVPGKRREAALTLKDLDVLEDALGEHRPALLVVDPLQAYLGADVDMHRANEVRPVLTGLVRLADRFACTVLGIRHLCKGAQASALHRGLGSIDFTACARSVLLAGEDQKTRTCGIVHLKSSVRAKGVPLGYVIRETAINWNGERIEAGQLEWTGPSEHTARDLTAGDVNPEEREDRTEKDEAKELLLDYLAQLEQGAPVRSSVELECEAKGLSVSKRTLERVRRDVAEAVRIEGLRRAINSGALKLALPAEDADKKNAWFVVPRGTKAAIASALQGSPAGGLLERDLSE